MNVNSNFTTTVTLAAMTLAAPSLTYAEELSLRLGSGHPIGLLAYTETASAWFAPELKKRVEELTDHTIEVQEFHAGQVAKVTEVLAATQDGILDVGFISMIFEPSNLYLQNFTLFLPFSSPDAVAVTQAGRATYEAFPQLHEIFESEFNQIFLGGACIENYGLGTTFAWSEFSDLEGRKIAGAGTNLEWITGATAVASNLNEAYQSMQSGVYEGYISASPWWHTFKLNEVAPHFTRVDFGAQYLNAVTINKQKWDSLPEDVQAILRDLGDEWSGVTAEVCARNDAEGLATLRDLDVSVVEILPEAKVAWANSLADFPQRMADELAGRGHPEGAEVMKFYMDQIEQTGFTWPNRYDLK